jgi:uncharacterized protein YjdB
VRSSALNSIHRAAVAVLALASLACGSSSEPAAPVSSVAAIVINPSAPTLALNASLPLQVQVQDASGAVVADAPVIWTVRDPNVAKVSETGVVTALALGTTEVAASSRGKSGIATITVQRTPVATVVLRPDRVDAVVGSHTPLTATALDATQATLPNRGFVWTTSNANVATVDGTGVVTGVGAGSAVITATSEGKSASSTFTVMQGAVASVTVTPSPITMVAGQSTQLAASARDASGSVITGKSVVWSSSNTAVASVTAQGVVSGVGAGSTTITATVDGVSGTSAVTVSDVPVAKVVVSPQAPTVTTGSSAQLTATLTDASGNAVSNRVVTWTTSNAAIASVSSTGVVTGIIPGTATITATSEGKSGSTTVTVTLLPVGSVAVSPSTLTLTPGQAGALAATVTDANGQVVTNRPVSWTTSDGAIATVSQTGDVTAVAPGSATITATSGSKSGAAVVTVSQVPVANVTVSPSTLPLTQGQTGTLTATATDAAGNVLNRTLTWTSDNTSVATVSGTGVVTAVAPGTATVTAAESGGKSGSSAVTVAAIPIASVTIAPSTSTVTVGQGTQLTATVKDVNGNVVANPTVAWQSSNTNVASVSSTGAVMTTASGTVTITASSGGQSGTAVVTVNPSTPTPGPVATVQVTPALATVRDGKTLQLSAKAYDAVGVQVTNVTFTWATGAGTIASVNQSGLVTGKKVGTVTITASTSGKTGSSLVTVTP